MLFQFECLMHSGGQQRRGRCYLAVWTEKMEFKSDGNHTSSGAALAAIISRAASEEGEVMEEEASASLVDGPSQPATNSDDGFTLVTSCNSCKASSTAAQQSSTHRASYMPEQLKAMHKHRDDFNKKRALNLATLDSTEVKCLISVVRTGKRTLNTAQALNKAARAAGALYQAKRVAMGDVFAVDPKNKKEAINSLCSQGYIAFDVQGYNDWLHRPEIDRLALTVTVPEVPGEQAESMAKQLVQLDEDQEIVSIMLLALPAAPMEKNPSGRCYQFRVACHTEVAVEAVWKWLLEREFQP